MQTFLILEAVLFTFGFNSIGAQKVADITGAKYTSICDQDSEHHALGPAANSSVTFRLTPATAANKTACTVSISAPDTHVIYVRVADVADAAGKQPPVPTEQLLPSCPLNVYSTETIHRTTWREDPCHTMTSADGVLLLNNIQIDWRPPQAGQQLMKDRQLVITALGKGETCEAENQHACLRVGWTPLLCVAEELVCDGVVHCPPGSQLGDEFCRDQQIMAAANWERIANDFLRKFTGKSKTGNLLPAIDVEDTKWFNLKKNSLATISHADEGDDDDDADADADAADAGADTPNGITEALAHYGPWGYLMLGMLICGTILMFCGLWECCCRRPKPHTEPTTPTSPPPTTVLIINSATDGDAQTPPRYEDLDQPPSYDALFPHDQSKHNSCSGTLEEAELYGDETRPHAHGVGQARAQQQ